MRHILTIFILFIINLSFAQNLTKEFAEKGGQLIVMTRYSIGEASYSEENIIIEKFDSVFVINIFIDSSSYFVKYKNYNWKDTVINLELNKIEYLIALEKKLFKKGLKPTYNCDGANGRIIHNQTGILFIYDKNKTFSKEKVKELKITEAFAKTIKMKSVSIGGGFLSMKEELINLGSDFQRCKTNWWTN